MPLTIEIDVSLFDVIFLRLQQFLCIGIAVFFSLKLLDKRLRMTTLPGLWAIAVILMATSVYDLLTFTDYDYIRAVLAQLSEPLFHARYAFSIFLRFAWIAISVGLLLLRPWARMSAIYLSLFTVATIMWKHPYYVFENIAIMVEQQGAQAPISHLQYPDYPWISMFLYVSVDIVISVMIITYLMLEHVSGQFRHDNKDQQTTRAA